METEVTKSEAMQLTPVGVVESELKTPMLCVDKSGLSLIERLDQIKAHHRKVKDTVCKVIIYPPWAPLLDGIVRPGDVHDFMLFAIIPV